MDAADLRVARIGQHRIGELEFGRRLVLGRHRGGEVRHRIILRIEADRVDLREIGDRGLGLRVGLAVGEPQRLVVACFVELLDAGAVIFAGDEAVELLAGDQLAQLVGHLRVRAGGRCRCGRSFGRLGVRRRGILLGLALRLDAQPGRPWPSAATDRLSGIGIAPTPLVGLLREAGVAGQRQDQARRQWRPADAQIVRISPNELPKAALSGLVLWPAY